MTETADRIAASPSSQSIEYHRRLEAILVRIRWIAVFFCLAMVGLAPKSSPVLIGVVAGGLALGNLVLMVCLARASAARHLAAIGGAAMALEWLVTPGMIVAGSSDPMNPVPAVLIILVLVSGLRHGLTGVAGASVGSGMMVGAAIIRQTFPLGVLRPAVAAMVLARWEAILLAAGLAIGLLLWAGQKWLYEETTLWQKERTALQRKVLRVSDREMDVLRMMACLELSYDDIGERISISSRTVKTHGHRLSEKLGVANRRQVIVAAAREQWLLPPSDSTDRCGKETTDL
ncbi:MAG: LuxR C-terminal-related transcriptional regulator [Terriglobia bacterium]